jgi:TPR repeat protein
LKLLAVGFPLISSSTLDANLQTDWGDVDALAEAGFCYAQGMGCKKNLKKSAKFYRMAEAKGMSMVGNSWYVSQCRVDLLFHTLTYSQDTQG